VKSYLNRLKGNKMALAVALPAVVVVPLLIMTFIGGPQLIYFWVGIGIGMVWVWWTRRGEESD